MAGRQDTTMGEAQKAAERFNKLLDRAGLARLMGKDEEEAQEHAEEQKRHTCPDLTTRANMVIYFESTSLEDSPEAYIDSIGLALSKLCFGRTMIKAELSKAPLTEKNWTNSHGVGRDELSRRYGLLGEECTRLEMLKSAIEQVFELTPKGKRLNKDRKLETDHHIAKLQNLEERALPQLKNVDDVRSWLLQLKDHNPKVRMRLVQLLDLHLKEAMKDLYLDIDGLQEAILDQDENKKKAVCRGDDLYSGNTAGIKREILRLMGIRKAMSTVRLQESVSRAEPIALPFVETFELPENIDDFTLIKQPMDGNCGYHAFINGMKPHHASFAKMTPDQLRKVLIEYVNGLNPGWLANIERIAGSNSQKFGTLRCFVIPPIH